MNSGFSTAGHVLACWPFCLLPFWGCPPPENGFAVAGVAVAEQRGVPPNRATSTIVAVAITSAMGNSRAAGRRILARACSRPRTRAARGRVSPAAGRHPEPDPEEQNRQSVSEFLYSGHFLIKS